MTKGVEDLWERYVDERTPELRNQLVVHYSPLVKFVAGRWAGRVPGHVDPQDLTSEGLIGLLDAVERFDPGRGLRFSTFAVPRIVGAIRDGLRSWDWVPRPVREEIRKLEAARHALESAGLPVDEAHLAEAMGASAAEVRRIEASRAAARLAPLDDQLNDQLDDKLEHPEYYSSSGTEPGPAGGSLPAVVLSGMDRLQERDQIILALYYLEELTLSEIGEILDVTESRVSQLKARAIASLRSALVGAVASA